MSATRTPPDQALDALRLLDALRTRLWLGRAARAAGAGLWLGASLVGLGAVAHVAVRAHSFAPVLVLAAVPALLLVGRALGRGRPSRALAARDADARLGAQALLASALDQCARPVERRAPMAALVLAQADALAREQHPRLPLQYPLPPPRRLLVPLALALGFACAYLLPGARAESVPQPPLGPASRTASTTAQRERRELATEASWRALSPPVRVHASSGSDERAKAELASEATTAGAPEAHEHEPASPAGTTPARADSSAPGEPAGSGAGDAARGDSRPPATGAAPKLVIRYREPSERPGGAEGQGSSRGPGRAPDFAARAATRAADAVSRGAGSSTAALPPALRAYVGAYMTSAASSQAAAWRP